MATAQQEADRIFEYWRLQARMGIPAAQRRLPEKDAEYERDLEVLRQVFGRGAASQIGKKRRDVSQRDHS